jgi:adenine-specific DNA-methyltransferase
MDGNSLNITQDLLEKLKELVPQAFSEEKLDLQKLQTLLGEVVNTDNERYQLSWAGKSEAYKVLQMPTTATLIPQPEQSVNWDESENIFIEGENLEVLKVLQKSYYGKIKMIYIDPPYNTGSDSFIYPDKFSETKEEYLKRIGEKDEEGYMMKEGLFRKNSKENGQFHSNWLNMMLPRLFLARNLLKEDGVIFVSIDDNEQANLKLLMDEVFGEENLIGTVIWKNATDNNPTQIAVEHEYLIVYAKNKSSIASEWKSKISDVKNKLIEIGDELINKHKNLEELQASYNLWYKQNKAYLSPMDRYKYIDFDGIYIGSQSVHNPGKEGYRYDVIHPVTGKPCKQPLMGYRFPEETMKNLLEKEKILFGEDESKIIELKVYAKDYQDKLSSIIDLDGRIGSYDLKELFPESTRVFNNPKPIRFLNHFIPYVLEDGEIILDFFAGAASTAHAIIELNSEDNHNRKFICVQLPEKTDEKSEAFKLGYKTISEISEARIKNAIKKSEKKRSGQLQFDKGQNLGFRKYTLSSSNFKIWRGDVAENEAELTKQMELFVTPQRANAQSENILWELLIKNGVPLTEKIQQIEAGEEASIYHTSDKRFAFVLDKYTPEVQEKVLALKPRTVICLDSLFQNEDMVKTNAQLKLEDNGITFKTV